MSCLEPLLLPSPFRRVGGDSGDGVWLLWPSSRSSLWSLRSLSAVVVVVAVVADELAVRKFNT